jgi:hypothetical protein
MGSSVRYRFTTFLAASLVGGNNLSNQSAPHAFAETATGSGVAMFPPIHIFIDTSAMPRNLARIGHDFDQLTDLPGAKLIR